RFLLGDHLPTATHVSSLWAEQVDLQLTKRQVAHFLAFGLVAVPVALQRGLPAERLVLAGEEGQLIRAPVAGHEAFEVALVPGGGLVLDHSLDGFLCCVCVVLRRKGQGWRHKEQSSKDKGNRDPGNAVHEHLTSRSWKGSS